MSQNLYLIEILVKEILFNNVELDKWGLAVDVVLGPIAELTIQFEERNESFDIDLANPGKSFLFPASNYVLKSQIEESDILFTVRCLDNKEHRYGRARMKWPYSFKKLVRKSDDQSAIPFLEPAAVTEDLVWEEGTDREPSAPPPDGYVRVFMRLSSFGRQITTPYQVLQTKDEALSYLFKGTKVPASFRSPEYGKHNDQDLLALGPIFSNRDKEQKGSDYSIDITVSEIEASLCKDEECLACHKFKAFGIGPLAKQKKVIISPCNDPVCEFAYEKDKPPCVGNRKCSWNLAEPANLRVKRRILADGTCATETCCPWDRDDANYMAEEPGTSTRTTSTQIDSACVNPPGGQPGSVTDDPKMCPIFASPVTEASTANENKCPFTGCTFDANQREASTSVGASVAPSCNKHLRGGGNDTQNRQISADVKIQHTCSKQQPSDTENPSTMERRKGCTCGKSGVLKGKQSNNAQKPTYCEDCGGYSKSGKTCKDLNRVAGGGMSLTHNVQDYMTIKNVRCFCNDSCQKSACKGSQTEFCNKTCKETFKQIENHFQAKEQAFHGDAYPDGGSSTICECNESSPESQASSCNNKKCLQRLKSGANIPSSGNEKAVTGVSPVSGKPLSQTGPGGDLQSRRHYCGLVYNIGDTYPGNKRGHKICFPKIITCPSKKGWNWQPEPLVFPLKPRRDYHPGFIPKDVQQIINDLREAAGLPLAQPKTSKKKKKKFKSGVSSAITQEDDDEEDDDEYEVEERQTLTFSKTKGQFVVNCSPLRDPKKVADNEDPYINCPPISIKYTPDPLKYMDREDACDCCTCKDEDESDEDDDLNLDFSPPMGVIEMERMKKSPNVVHFWTQYDTADFGFPSPKAQGKKGKK